MIPAFLGNLVGGGLFVGVVYWYLYIQGDSRPIFIDGEAFEMASEPLFGRGESPTGTSMGNEQSQRRSAENMV